MREPSPRTRPRRAAALSALAFAALVAVVARPDAVAAGPGWRWAPADTDSVAVVAPAAVAPDSVRLDSVRLDSVRLDSVRLDSVRIDTGAADSTARPVTVTFGDAPADTTDSLSRARTYFPSSAAVGPTVAAVPRRLPGVRGRLGSYWRREVALDTASYVYRVREVVGDDDVRAPAALTLPEYLAARRQQALGEQFRTLAAQRDARQQRGAGGLGFAVDIPGGDQSAFRTLFGKNEVALTVNGTSNVDLGVRYDQSDRQQALSNGSTSPFAPDFGQDLNLNVAGTIGDKLAINVNYDTQSQFDFENQVSLVYTGYDDDIVQRIEAGNVFLQTPSTLIRGGQRLFGLRTDLQFGPLAVTAVASQQDAETVDRVFEGGTDVQGFRLAPYTYENNAHFFLGYSFHNWWDRAHAQPQAPTLPPGLAEVSAVEVWRHEPGLVNTANQDVETTWAIALADLGEPPAVLGGGEAYLGAFDPETGRYPNENAGLPAPARDQYPDALLARLRRDGASTSVATLNRDPAVTRPLPQTGAFSNNVFRRLKANVDYTFDGRLGRLTLTNPLSDGDELAVAYQYRTSAGQVVDVGDFNNPAQGASQSGPRTILKLIRADNPTPASPLWDLTMRNVYRVGGQGLTEPNFTLGITFEAPGRSASALPPADELSLEQRTFLQVLGLDRVNGQGRPQADDRFDFLSGVTVLPDNGRVLFPVRQPFGDYLLHLVRDGWTVGTIGAADGRVAPTYGTLTQAEAIDRYVPGLADPNEDGGRATMYDLLPSAAEDRLRQLAGYRIAGEFKGGSQSVFNIGFQLVEGTVRVTSGALPLTEGVDYRVNYAAGTVEITNPTYLQQGQGFQVSVEQNQFFNVGSKSLVGVRADLRLDEDFTLGATLMRLAERPLGDKFLIGEEPLNNSVVGFDGAFKAEPRWMTRALDALPLIQTRAPSRFEVRGEVARLNPGSPQTLAFSRARDALQDSNLGLDFADDELAGVSFIDSFEQSENTYTALGLTAGWRLAAPPTEATGDADGGPFVDVTDPDLPTSWRGLFTWYTLSENNYKTFREAGLQTPATEPVPVVELFPQRPPPQGGRRDLDLLDLYFDPTRRGPYNFSRDLTTRFAQRPEDVWGGFAQPIASSYRNFDGQNNVEFVEMVFAPLGGRDGSSAVGDQAVMYLDLGRFSEETLPNGFLNAEDGLVSNPSLTPGPLDNWGRRPSGVTDGLVNLDRDTERTEDLGLDGLPSLRTLGAAPYPVSEQDQFRAFLDRLPVDTPEQRRAALDPSADDYYYFTDTRFDDPLRYPGPLGASVQERFAHFLPATEVNAAQSQQRLVENGRAAAITPDSEDLNGDNQLETTEAFHRYTIPLQADALRASPFFQSLLTTTDDRGATQQWYLLRVPVRTQNRRSFNVADDDFSRVESVRLWTTGHDRPVTMRFASFELVGSQWLKSTVVGVEPEAGDAPGASGGTAPALFIESINNEENADTYAVPRGTILSTSRTPNGAIRASREQALILRAERLVDGRRAAITRSYATRPLDLTKYSNLRMAVHGDGFDRSDSVRVFVRFGDDEGQNYYELEQPVYPFDPRRLDRLPPCPLQQSSNCVRSDSLWQTNVGGVRGRDLNPINVVVAELNRAKLERDRAGAPIGTRFTLADPEGAPPGARITVRGQPSIQDVRTVVMGVRNGLGGRAVVDTVSVWFNELRATGYDQDGGASGFLTATLGLADVAQVNARVSMTQDGFGELGGALGGRSFASQTGFTLTSSLNAHKLIPERFGWSIPVSFSVTENGTTPRFDPDNGDVRLADLAESARTGAPVGGVPGEVRAEAILDRARTQTSSRNVRVQVSKTGSRSPWLRYTLDGVTASYTRSTQDASNPSNQVQASEAWAGNVGYRIAVPRPLAVRPLWFAESVPVLGALGGLRLNVLPSNVALSADVGRDLSSTQPRLGIEFLGEPDSVRSFRSLVRRTQRFDHGRQLDVGYTPFPFLQTSFASTVSQDLGAAGQRSAFRVLVRDRDGRFSRTYALSPVDAKDPNGPVYRDLVAALDGFNAGDPFPVDRVEVLGGQDLTVLPFGEALGNAFGGDARTRSYDQRATASLRVSLAKLRWLSWLQLQPVGYSAAYTWRDDPYATAPDLDIARAGTQTQVQTGARVAPKTFWRLFPFYRALEASAGRGPGASRAAADSSGGGFRPLSLARDVFLAVTGIDDVSLTYRGSQSAAASGLAGQRYSLLSGLTGAAPPLGYRLGLTGDVGLDRRVGADAPFETFSDQSGTQHDLDARTQVSPLRGLQIGLNWRTAWGGAEEVVYRYDADRLVETPGLRTGTGTSTVVGLGGSYEGFVARHAGRYARDVAGATGGVVESEFRSPTGLAGDFQAELARGMGRFGPNGLYALPLPNWDVTYSGLERLPVLRSLASQVSLQHRYSATSETGLTTFLNAALVPGSTADNPRRYPFDDFTFVGDGARIADGFDEPTTVTVSQRLQPLVGLTFGFKSGLQASLSTNRTTTSTLNVGSADVYQKRAQDVRLDLSYARTGLRLLGLRGLNNNIRFQLTALVSDDATARRAFLADVRQAIAGEPLADPAVIRTSRIQVSPQISYTVSNRVTANVIGQYERTYADQTGGQSTQFNGGVSLRILFSN